MKHNLLITFVLGVAVLAGCKKEKNSSPSTSSSDSYLPVSNGSMWQYAVDEPGGTDTLTVTMTGQTMVSGGITYYAATSVYKHEGSTGPGYFFNSNHIYGTLGVNSSAGISITLDMLNDTASVGYTWTSLPTSDGMVNGIPARVINKIISKNGTMTIGSKTFTNVSHTTSNLQYNEGAGYETEATYDYYLSKGVGMIELDENDLGLTATEKLYNYTIK